MAVMSGKPAHWLLIEAIQVYGMILAINLTPGGSKLATGEK